MKRTTLVGLVISALWISAALTLVHLKRFAIETLTLNEWGDFFAGAVAPLAFFWLVLGYFQQGEELRLNTEALVAQQAELKRQVAETATLAKNAERQALAAEQLAFETKAEADRLTQKEKAEARPVFSSNGGSGYGGKLQMNLVNHGARVTDLQIMSSETERIAISPKVALDSGATAEVLIWWSGDYPVSFEIHCRDRYKAVNKQRFVMTAPFELDEHAT